MPHKFCTDGSHELATSSEAELRARFVDVQRWECIGPNYIMGTCPVCDATLGIDAEPEQDIERIIAESELAADEIAESKGIA